MINQDLLTYIENEISRGTPKNIIQSNLLSNGWNEKDIAEGFSTVVVKNYNPTVTPPSTNVNVTQPVSSPLIKINLSNASEPVISQPTIPNPMMSPSTLTQQNFQRMSVLQMEPKKSHLTAVITILIILLALAGGGFAYYKYLIPNPPISITQNSLNQISTTTLNINESNIESSSTLQIISTSSAEQSTSTNTTTSSLSASSNIIDCGTSVDPESLPEVKQEVASGGTITTKDYEKDKALVCFGTNLLVCNKAKIKFTVSKPDLNSGIPLSMEIKNKDGENCVVRLDIKEKDLTNKYLQCPFPIKDIPDMTCPMGMCIKKGNPGSTGVGMLAPFAMGIQFTGVDALKNEVGCLTDL